MNKIVKFFILMLICTIYTAYPRQSIISKIYCSIFGNEDANPEYRQKVYQALSELGVSNPEDVPVKKMNGVGPIFARFDLSSFTAFGIWLDERYLGICSEEEKIFNIYHEAAHYVQNHHPKLLAQCSGAVVLTIAGFLALKKVLSPVNPWIKFGTMTGVAILATFCESRYLLPCFVRRQERQADIMAAKLLISTGREDLIDVHIEKLKIYMKKFKKTEKDLWWYSNKEVVEYLEKLKNKN